MNRSASISSSRESRTARTEAERGGAGQRRKLTERRAGPDLPQHAVVRGDNPQPPGEHDVEPVGGIARPEEPLLRP